ncbi:MAG: hypothetical protein HC888_07080 [Candidatus Competibacteraceae bacterium]|nr:hypothetical protein [Candidatus Competibacteraceae bacterium]
MIQGGGTSIFYLTEWAKAEEVEGTIRKYLKANSYSILAGTLEIFPSGNALRLPLQKGFGWLSSDGQLEVRREELTFGQALALFYNDLEENKRNWGEVQSLIERAISHAGAALPAEPRSVKTQYLSRAWRLCTKGELTGRSGKEESATGKTG